MIVAVKRNKKQKIVKFISLLVFGCILGSYYYYTSKTFAEQQQVELEDKKAQKLEEEKQEKTKKDIERAILVAGFWFRSKLKLPIIAKFITPLVKIIMAAAPVKKLSFGASL